ncbi:MAG: hypothetical protein HC866_01880 [Leptolyngbyaceae cyanobacterium RU_5_1]|nr:hypothetical protein [Leptolyngbyaceae cyanobacterium RU_5_1]
MSETPAKILTEAEIDDILIAQAEDESAWEEALQVHPAKWVALSLPDQLMARAAFLAQLDGESDVESWLMQAIQERIESEEATFLQKKRNFVHP